MYSKYLHVSSSTIFGILYYINRISSSQFFCRRRSYSALYIHGGNVDLTEFYNFFFVFFLFWSNANLSLVYLLFFKNESLPKTSCTDSIPHLVCRIVSILVLHYNKMTIVVGVFLYTSWGVEILLNLRRRFWDTRCDHFDALEWTDTKLRPKRPMRRSIHTN